MSTFPDYREFLGQFMSRGYEIKPLAAENLRADGVIYLRHDIDFDCSLALQMARTEFQLGVTSTYFFLIASDSYNLLSSSNSKCVAEIIELGHNVSIHFDPLLYSDFEDGLRKEVNIFRDVYGFDVDLVSLHRPNEFFLKYDSKICGIAHTYQKEFLKDLKYVSDSRGSFRYGPPNETSAFANGKSIHLLIHPIWWMMPSDSPQKSLDDLTLLKLKRFQDHIEKNCNAYKQINSSIAVEV